MSEYNADLVTLLQEDLSEPELYGDLIYKLRKIVRKTNSFFRYNCQVQQKIGWSTDILGTWYIVRSWCGAARIISGLQSTKY